MQGLCGWKLKLFDPVGVVGDGNTHTPGCASLTRGYRYLSPSDLWNSAVLTSEGNRRCLTAVAGQAAHPTGLIKNSPLKMLSGLC
jgi:hypothetical protein